MQDASDMQDHSRHLVDFHSGRADGGPSRCLLSGPFVEDASDHADKNDDDALHSFLSFSPSISDESVDLDVVYALHNFQKTHSDQISVLKGHRLAVLDDTNNFWWLVRNIETREVGYIPAENVE